MAVVATAVPVAAEVPAQPDATVATTTGPVHAIATDGTAVFLGGEFTAVGGLARVGLAKLDAATGAVVDTWRADVTGEVRSLSLSPDGSILYVGGRFTSVRGVARNDVAAVSTATGSVVSSWHPQPDDAVLALTATADHVYLGGIFTFLNGARAPKLARVDRATGALDETWLPKPNGRVLSLELSPDRSQLYVGGGFRRVFDRFRPKLAALRTRAAEVTDWKPAPQCPPMDLVFDGTGTLFVACAGGGTTGNRAIAYEPSSPTARWDIGFNGNPQAVAVVDGVVYIGGHFTEALGQRRRKAAAFDAMTGAMSSWAPEFDSPQGIEALVSIGSELWAGGTFTKVDRQPREGLACFR